MTIEELYVQRCQIDHDINEHLHTLRYYAEQCQSVTEFGTDIGFSTTAFLAAHPEMLHCYDLTRTPWVDVLESLARPTKFQFHQADTRFCPIIEETDLLFIDTVHTYEQVWAELCRHGDQASKFIIFHDVLLCHPILPAIAKWMSTRLQWQVAELSLIQNGLLVLCNISP